GETTLHAATAEQHGDASLDAGAEALPLLEGRTLFVSGDGGYLNAFLLAHLYIVLAVEAPIRTIQFRGVAEDLPVMVERSFDLIFVTRVSVQYFILGDQALSAFGQKNFVTELDRGLHLAALDQIGVGFKDGIDLLGAGHLLSLEHATAGLINHLLAQLAIMLDLLAEFAHGQVGEPAFALGFSGALEHIVGVAHHFLGNPNELAIFPGLLLLPLLGRHALELLHAPPGRSRMIAEPLDGLPHGLAQAVNQTSDHAHRIPQ